MSSILKGQFLPLEARRRPWLLFALLLTIPAFYLVLTSFETHFHLFGRAAYGVAALILAFDLVRQLRRSRQTWDAYRRRAHIADWLILIGAVVWSMRADAPWSSAEWWWRLGYCALVFIRLAQLLVGFLAPTRLLQILLLGCLMLVLSGAGFLWLEPKVHSFADGMWLAFTTVSTVGYGDIVPSSPAARVFAVFIVLLGYALFSVVTASIAALFIGEDEKRLERELHEDIRALRQEVAALRADLQKDKPQ